MRRATVSVSCRTAARSHAARTSHPGATAAQSLFRPDGSLTMYKPNFCCDCGERIQRARWRLWTSRRFCQDCAPRLRRARTAVVTAAGVALFGGGLLAGRGIRPADPPLVVERRDTPPAPPQTSRQAAPESSSTTPLAPAAVQSSTAAPDQTPENRPDPTRDPTARPAAEPEVVTICGAMTKKGTPCQRRVRGGGRCYQHRGEPAMLPPSKLIIKG